MRLLETIDLADKKVACFTPAILVILITVKISPFSSFQCFFKNFQNDGTGKSCLIGSLIDDFESKITSAVPAQNKDTLKTGPGWKKRIQLGLRNINQIGPRTEQTFLRGERTFLRGEQIFQRGERTFLRDEQTIQKQTNNYQYKRRL